METRLIIFLAFTSVALIMNTLLILLAYKAFAKVTTSVTESIREFENDNATREWIASVHSASEQAVTVTEAAKQKFVDYDSVMHLAQSRYQFALAKIDTRLASFEQKMSESTKQIQEKIHGPASKFASVAAGIQAVASRFGSEESEEE